MKHLIKLLVLLLVFPIINSCGGATPKQESMKPGAALTYIAGDVSLERDGKLHRVVSGDRLFESDLIITGTDSSADVAIKGFGVMKIGSNTRVRVAALTGTEDGARADLSLEEGDLVSIINREDSNHDYNVITPTAVAGVRGTLFLTSVSREGEDKVVRFAVAEGSIAVSSGADEVVLPPESELEIRRQSKLSKDLVRPLSPTSLQEIKKMAVFHKSNVSEFQSMIDEVKASSKQLQALEGEGASERSMEQRMEQEARLGDEKMEEAKTNSADRFIQRDTVGDPVKLEPNESFE